MDNIVNMDFGEIYLILRPYIDYVESAQFYPQALLLTLSIILYYLGKKRGSSEILISKRTKREIQQYKGKKEQREKQKYELLKESRKLSTYMKIQFFSTILLNAGLYYFDVVEVDSKIYIGLGSFSIIILAYIYSYVEKSRLAKIKTNLELSEKEIDNIVINLGQQLGDEIMGLLKKQFFKKENEEFIKKLQFETQQADARAEQKYKQSMEELRQRIKQLEDKDFQQKQEIHNFKRATLSHKTEPIPNNNNKQGEENVMDLRRQNFYLEQEGQIQRDMISKVINIEWCPDCINLKNHCIVAYFQKAKEIGEEYQTKLRELQLDHSKSKQANAQQKQ